MPTSMVMVGYLLAMGAGGSFVFQQAVNANLRTEIDRPGGQAVVSYLGGTLVMLLVALVLREPWMSKQMLQRSHLISWSGGVIGAIYIAISILLIPRLGAAMVIALIVAGQMLGSLVFDHFGLLGIPVHQASISPVGGRGPACRGRRPNSSLRPAAVSAAAPGLVPRCYSVCQPRLSGRSCPSPFCSGPSCTVKMARLPALDCATLHGFAQIGLWLGHFHRPSQVQRKCWSYFGVQSQRQEFRFRDKISGQRSTARSRQQIKGGSE